MPVNATLINLYHICHRELWLHAKGIRMEHTSDTVYEGKLIGNTSYQQRPEKYTELEIGGSKIDFYDARNKVVHEVKKSDKAERAHLAQVKYYLWLLEENGVEGATGILEYPKLRQTEQVVLTDKDRSDIMDWLTDIDLILARKECPGLLNKPICQRCSYFDFCYSAESG
ncbi:CRISPR-associated protein Cas4 [Rufibacter quisquiliarum]|uniref:CRISPR-associated exonuclease Cas4 n=1 Tax=Rufibacter quisquiliarum TaxID=1549639 RepID=A0A839GDV4_9BACT|nr:CRISPR-associated protein Cas4 [Rufibacter quisquiliarum]MBA9075713.1 CRISPR-associated exonuclease Cas4 [Rufibacter quisquiliarum]